MRSHRRRARDHESLVNAGNYFKNGPVFFMSPRMFHVLYNPLYANIELKVEDERLAGEMSRVGVYLCMPEPV